MTHPLTVRVDAPDHTRYAADALDGAVGQVIRVQWVPAPDLAHPQDLTVHEGEARLAAAAVVDDGEAVEFTFDVPDPVTSLMLSDLMLRHLGAVSP